jgi:hypothetical protein
MANEWINKFINEYMDDEEIIDLAIKCETEQEFKEAYPEAYRVASERGLEYLDEVCRHMVRIPRPSAMSKEEIIKEAKKYNTRTDFAKYSQEAYQAAWIQGKDFLEQVCAHIKPNNRGNKMNPFSRQVHSPGCAQKVIPRKNKIDLIEFLEEVDVQYVEQGKHNDKIKEYIHKNNKQVKQINKAHENFITVMGDKMSSTELTYTRFKSIVDTAVKAMTEKNKKNLEVLKTLVVMDESNFSDEIIYEKNFKLLDDNFVENEKNVSVVYDISLKLSQMKNKDSIVEHSCAMTELNVLQKNIDGYIK